MDRPLVSILVGAYQRGPFIADALDSALAQTYPNIEIIVGDDGSTDGTFETIESYARRFPGRINALPRRVNAGIPGVVENANRMLLASRGKYLCFLDADDLYLPEKVEKQVAWLEQDGRRVLCAHDVEAFDSTTDSPLFRMRGRLRFGVGPEMIVRIRVSLPTVGVMVRASSRPAHGFDPRVRLALDWLFWIECLGSAGMYGYVDGVHARYRVHPGNLSRSPDLQAILIEDAMTTLALAQARHPQLASACREGRSAVIRRAAWIKLRDGDVAAARQLAVASLRERITWRTLLLAPTVWLPRTMAIRVDRWFRRHRIDQRLLQPSNPYSAG